MVTSALSPKSDQTNFISPFVVDASLFESTPRINDSEINYKKITDERIHVELCLLKLASYKKDTKKKTS